MLNQVVMVGRIANEPELTEVENNQKLMRLVLAVPRSYKNADGEYDTDFIPVVLWRGIAANTAEYCNKGDLIGVKGHVKTGSYEKDDKKNYTIEIVAEKITFLSSKKN